MLSIHDAETTLSLLKTHAPETVMRFAMPHTPELMQFLHDAGYLPVLEHNAWNEKEIVISTPKHLTFPEH
jgi:hypothetical protein